MEEYTAAGIRPVRPASPSRPFHVLIVGGGIVGLTIAQACQQNGISYAVYERDEPGFRRQGWALTLHWCLNALERTIGEVRMREARKVSFPPCT